MALVGGVFTAGASLLGLGGGEDRTEMINTITQNVVNNVVANSVVKVALNCKVNTTSEQLVENDNSCRCPTPDSNGKYGKFNTCDDWFSHYEDTSDENCIKYIKALSNSNLLTNSDDLATIIAEGPCAKAAGGIIRGVDQTSNTIFSLEPFINSARVRWG